MNPLDFVSNLTKKKTLNETYENGPSYEFLAIGVFIFVYILIRLVEKYVIPLIPEFIRTETMALFKWGPILIPIIFGIAYMKPKKKFNDKNWNKIHEKINNINNEDIKLKEKMSLWKN